MCRRPILDAGVCGRNQRASDPEILLFADESVRVVHAKRETEQRRHRAERDVPLVPGAGEPQDAPPLVLTPADNAEIRDRRRIRARVRVRECEAGDFESLRKPRQVVPLLFFRPVMEQQLARSQRVRHHGRHGNSARSRRKLGDGLRMRVGGKAEPAVFLGNDHPEEALVLDELPHVRRQVAVDVGGLPIGGESAQFFDLVVEETLFLRRAGRAVASASANPACGEQVAIPPTVPASMASRSARHRRSPAGCSHRVAEARRSTDVQRNCQQNEDGRKGLGEPA
jgi:hypothetical protein